MADDADKGPRAARPDPAGAGGASRDAAPKGIALRWIGLAIAGIALGAGSAVAMSGGSLGAGRISAGGWSTDPTVGSEAANPWVRARIARVGLLALDKSETVYFDLATDAAGQSLREACDYRLSGGALPARWWSVTIYGADQMLPRNADGAGSVDATRLAAQGPAWSASITPTRPSDPAAGWISSKGAGTFSLTLRLYNPADISDAGLAALPAPKLERLSCRGGA